MNVLITGCGGFIGSHLAELMLSKKMNVYGTVFDFDGLRNISHIKDEIKILKCDMNNKKDVEDTVKNSMPGIIFHMAAQSFVIPSWEDPEKTLKTNVLGTLYLLEAARKFCPESIIQVACSSAEYGFIDIKEVPVKESNPFRPSSPYAVSKIGQDMLSYLYWSAYKMKIIRSRFFNTTGPRKTFDACSDFAKGIAEIEAGKRDRLTVGNLSGIRDITDVRDAVRAADMLCQNGEYGEVYNICSGTSYRIKELLDRLISMSNTEIKAVISPDPMRKIDDPIFIGDNSKISKLGWKSQIPIEKTLLDMLNYWREQVFS